MRSRWPLWLVILLVALAGRCVAADLPAWVNGAAAGPYPVRVLHVDEQGLLFAVARIDGTAVPAWWRLAGVELPQASANAACVDERSRAAAAVRSIRTLTAGQRLWLAGVDAHDHAHPVGRFILDDGRELGEVLVSFSLARRVGTAHRDPWCGW